jgi:galactitol-specific phosphotransferase system IIC component
MKALNALLWQIIVVLGLMYFGMNYTATFAAGVCIGIWFCVINLAIYIERLKNE